MSRDGVPLNAAAIVTGVAVEGAVDFFFGRPLEENPYSRECAAHAWESWRRGWLDASAFEQLRGATERRRWLREAA